MENTYEIIDGTFYFHSGEEITEFDLMDIICELEKMTGNAIEKESGSLREHLDAEDGSGRTWVDVEMWQIEDAIDNLSKQTLTTIELTEQERELIQILLNRFYKEDNITWGKEKESILNKLNAKTK